MDCRAAYVCIALSQNRGFFFRESFVLFARQKKSPFKNVD